MNFNMIRILERLKSLYLSNRLLGINFVTSAERCEMLNLAINYVRDEKVDGEYYEFGVARGKSFIPAYHLSRKMGFPIKKFHAFDSFQGLPKPRGVDLEFERFKEGEEKWSLELFKKNLKKYKVDTLRVRIYKGWFEKTLTKKLSENLSKAGKASVIWIDCDLYQSTKEVLNFIRPLLQQGSVLIFDDWYCYRGSPDKGEQRATKEFLSKNGDVRLIQFRKFGVVGNSFIVDIKNEKTESEDGKKK